MRVVKPLRTAFVHRVHSQAKRHVMVTTVGFAMPFEAPHRLLTEVELWKMAATDLGRFGVLDHWMRKPQAEVLVTGACYTGDEPRGSDYVRVGVGPEGRRLVDKTLYVFGDRHWTLLGPSEPEPFTRMPVDWAHAFGGPSHPPNPVGKGLEALVDDTSGATEHPLPNVEDPKHLMASKGDKGVPASFAPWDPLWPYHFEKKMGTYGRDHVAESGLAMADDADPSLFNVAPPDQRVKGYFEGTEEIHVEHMHPDARVQETRLPGLRARCLVRLADDPRRVVDVPLSLDTIHLFPHRARLVVFFRGAVSVRTSDASDVTLVVVGLEDLEADRRPVDEYLAVVDKRLDPERGALESLRDRDLVPASVEVGNAVTVGDPLEGVLERDDTLRKNMHRRAEREYAEVRDRLLARGVEPELLPPPPAPPEPLRTDVDLGALGADLERERATATTRGRALEADLRRQLEAIAADHRIDLGSLEAEAARGASGPPAFTAAREMERLEQSLVLSRNAGMEIPGLAARLEDPTLLAQLLEVERKLQLSYRLSAHLGAPAVALSDEDSARARAELQAVVLGAVKERRDFTGADLAGLDLSGLDLEGLFFECANLARTNLSGAKLGDAVLARSNLEGADLSGATLTRANLGRARLEGARLAGARLDHAILYEADLSHASLDRALLHRANTLSMRCEGTSFVGIDAEELLFFRAKLASSSFRGARVVRSVFLDCDARAIDCARSDFSKTVFLATNAEAADFTEATAEGLRVVGSSFERAKLRDARMPGANLREANLRGADLVGANLKRSLLAGADLREADLTRALLVEAILIDADLGGARLVGANLMLAILHRAVLRGVDASGASLFCADLTGAVGDERTSFAGSNVKRALVAGVMHV